MALKLLNDISATCPRKWSDEQKAEAWRIVLALDIKIKKLKADIKHKTDVLEHEKRIVAALNTVKQEIDVAANYSRQISSNTSTTSESYKGIKAHVSPSLEIPSIRTKEAMSTLEKLKADLLKTRRERFNARKAIRTQEEDFAKLDDFLITNLAGFDGPESKMIGLFFAPLSPTATVCHQINGRAEWVSDVGIDFLVHLQPDRVFSRAIKVIEELGGEVCTDMIRRPDPPLAVEDVFAVLRHAMRADHLLNYIHDMFKALAFSETMDLCSTVFPAHDKASSPDNVMNRRMVEAFMENSHSNVAGQTTEMLELWFMNWRRAGDKNHLGAILDRYGIGALVVLPIPELMWTTKNESVSKLPQKLYQWLLDIIAADPKVHQLLEKICRLVSSIIDRKFVRGGIIRDRIQQAKRDILKLGHDAGLMKDIQHEASRLPFDFSRPFVVASFGYHFVEKPVKVWDGRDFCFPKVLHERLENIIDPVTNLNTSRQARLQLCPSDAIKVFNLLAPTKKVAFARLFTANDFRNEKSKDFVKTFGSRFMIIDRVDIEGESTWILYVINPDDDGVVRRCEWYSPQLGISLQGPREEVAKPTLKMLLAKVNILTDDDLKVVFLQVSPGVAAARHVVPKINPFIATVWQALMYGWRGTGSMKKLTQEDVKILVLNIVRFFAIVSNTEEVQRQLRQE